MTTNLAPNPGTVAGRIGAGLRASALSVQVTVTREVGLAVRVAGPTAAWALVDGRFPDRPRQLVNWGLILCDPADDESTRFRRISGKIAKLHTTLVELGVDLPPTHQVGVAYVGPGGAVGGLGDLIRDDPAVAFVSPTAGSQVKALALEAADLCDELLTISGESRIVIATDGSVARGRRGAGAGWVDSWGGYGHAPVDSALIVVAEVAAIAHALSEVPRAATDVTVRVDSRAAIAIARQALEGGPGSGPIHTPAKAHGHAVRIYEVGKRVPVRLEWVHAHNGDLMNETADRLAVLARRTRAANLPPELVEEMAARIMDDHAAVGRGELLAAA